MARKKRVSKLKKLRRPKENHHHTEEMIRRKLLENMRRSPERGE